MRITTPQEDKINWKLLWNEQMKNLKEKDAIYSIWQEGIEKLGLNDSFAPTIPYLNKVSKKFNGWKFFNAESDVIMPAKDWNLLIEKKRMPINSFIRTIEELDYCNEPDKWHDIIGHIPLLMDKRYSDMYVRLAKLYLLNQQAPIEEVTKAVNFLGAYGIELGLVRENGGVKAFGATLYSSSGELENAYKKVNQKVFSREAIEKESKRYDRREFQGTYYIFESMDEIIDYIAYLENLL